MKIFQPQLLVLLFGLLLGSTSLQAQNYDLAGGVRFGRPNSLSLKKTIGEGNALEAIVGYRGSLAFYNQVNLGLGYQRHSPLPDLLEGLNWYWGLGGSVYFYSYNLGFGADAANVGFGALGFLGLDYTLEDTPINITLDWAPSLVFGDDIFNGFYGGYGGVGIRYVIK